MTREESTPLPGRTPIPRSRHDWPWLRRLLLVGAGILALDALVGERSLLQTVRAERARARAVLELDDLRRQNAELLERVQQLTEDANAVEGVAREELGLIRRGEILVVLSGPPRR